MQEISIPLTFSAIPRYPNSTNGPFLRLTDDSGWLFETKHGETLLQRSPVTNGLVYGVVIYR